MNVISISKTFCALAVVAAIAIANSASAAFIVPDSATAPFASWSRTAPNSMYAEWNVFTSALGGTNTPEVGQFGPATANLQNTVPGAFLTGGGNIYSPTVATNFDVTVPNYGYGVGYPTRVVAQVLTAGNPLNQNSMRLTYNDGNGNQTLLPNQVNERTAGTEWLFVWDIPNFNPASMLVEFAASATSMSLDRFAIDTHAIPEPTTLVLVGLGLSMMVCGQRRRSGSAIL